MLHVDVLEINGVQYEISDIDDSVVSGKTNWSSEKISAELAKLSYEPIDIESFRATPSSAEVGSTVSVALNWEFNKIPASVTLSGTTLTPAISGSRTVSSVKAPSNYPTSTSTGWTLSATDEEGASDSATASIYFYNGVYYGISEQTSSLDSAFVLGLQKTLRGSKLTNFSVSAGEGEYIYYCLPVRYGQCSFSVGGFTGGFSLVDTIAFTNASGYTENYYVYRSDNASLGDTTVTVS